MTATFVFFYFRNVLFHPFEEGLETDLQHFLLIDFKKKGTTKQEIAITCLLYSFALQ